MTARDAIALSLTGLLLTGPTACTDAPSGPDGSEIQQSAVEADRELRSGTVHLTVGRPDVGTDYFPPGTHDDSYHAQDAIRPRTTVVAAGTMIEFLIAAGHNVSIYEPGIGPGDIDLSLLEPAGVPFPFPPLINDPTGRLARADLNFGPTVVWSWTFEERGRYLVICDVLPHFTDARMYAWIRVE